MGDDSQARTPTRVLVVDDEQSILGFVRLVLEDEGFEVATAPNGQEALDCIRESKPDLVKHFTSQNEHHGSSGMPVRD